MSLFFAGILAISLTACVSPQLTQALIQVKLVADGQTRQLSLSAGSTVQQAITSAGITLGNLDQIDPPSYTTLTTGAIITVTRVKESFDVSDVTIPFEHQIVKNESLPAGQELLIQPGVNGLQEITTRIIYTDGVETSRNIMKTVTIKEAIPEIMMVGIQAPFASFPIKGRLIYLIAGNAWLMENSTGNRRPIVTTGDLDGRIFSLSPDGQWLLFTRKISTSGNDTINSLWVINISDSKAKPIDLNIKNIVHFADWVPGQSRTISYSTVEPRSTSPGWQANNDLHLLSFDVNGKITDQKEIISTNSGGIYGWWGTYFAWSPDGTMLAYARPDEVGLVDLVNGTFSPKLKIVPLQTHSDWAWVPPINWSPDDSTIFTVVHNPGSGQVSAEESQEFSVEAILIKYGPVVSLVQQSGMFAYPVSSPGLVGNQYQVCFLQAVFPDQSDASRYQLDIMDQDGANRRALFPNEGSQGLDPQQIVWAPRETEDSGGLIAFIYQGNIWFLDTVTGETYQITGDGLTSAINWK